EWYAPPSARVEWFLPPHGTGASVAHGEVAVLVVTAPVLSIPQPQLAQGEPKTEDDGFGLPEEQDRTGTGMPSAIQNTLDNLNAKAGAIQKALGFIGWALVAVAAILLFKG
ncbi:MAG: hypothetical protein WCL27_12310, partial [Betaproteobacteria bacterium]